jgi:hypothetical protein
MVVCKLTFRILDENAFIPLWVFGRKALHSYLEDDEPDQCFTDLDVILKENRRIEVAAEGDNRVAIFLDHVVKKN